MNKPKIEWLKVEEFLLKSDKIGSHWQWDKHFFAIVLHFFVENDCRSEKKP